MTSDESPAGAFVVPSDDPCLDGHFPGNPVVPGVVILDFAARALAQQGIGGTVTGVTQVKFANPLRPLEPFTIECHRTEPRRASFRCVSAGRLLAAGVFELRD